MNTLRECAICQTRYRKGDELTIVVGGIKVKRDFMALSAEDFMLKPIIQSFHSRCMTMEVFDAFRLGDNENNTGIPEDNESVIYPEDPQGVHQLDD